MAPGRAAPYPEGNRDIHGLATHMVYGCHSCLQHRWALTPPFHPYPLRGGCFLLHYNSLATIFPL